MALAELYIPEKDISQNNNPETSTSESPEEGVFIPISTSTPSEVYADTSARFKKLIDTPRIRTSEVLKSRLKAIDNFISIAKNTSSEQDGQSTFEIAKKLYYAFRKDVIIWLWVWVLKYSDGTQDMIDWVYMSLFWKTYDVAISKYHIHYNKSINMPTVAGIERNFSYIWKLDEEEFSRLMDIYH